MEENIDKIVAGEQSDQEKEGVAPIDNSSDKDVVSDNTQERISVDPAQQEEMIGYPILEKSDRPHIAPAAALPREPTIHWTERHDIFKPKEMNIREFTQTVKFEKPQYLSKRHPYLFIQRSILRKIYQHVAGSYDERGGLLIGDCFFDKNIEQRNGSLGQYFVVVRGSVMAEGSEGSRVHLALTAGAWENMSQQIKALNPEWTIVGWYHSHPGLGVFLSSTDRHTQSSFFSQIWQVALVVDPHSKKRGFFFGSNGIRTQNVIIFDERIDNPQKDTTEKPRKQ